MRVRVRFRYRADTGEVEMFEVDDLRVGPRLADHDARHERAAADVAGIVESNARIEEVRPGTEQPPPVTVRMTDEQQSADDRRDQRRERHLGG
jgi:FtsH ternary system domain X3